MTVYSVYEPPEDNDGDDLSVRAEQVAFVKEGFNWVALFVPWLWLIYQRMWLELVAFLAAIVGISWMLGTGDDARQLAGWLSLGLSVLIAFEASDLRGWALQRRGFRFAGAASGRDRIEAERTFFSDWLPKQLPSAAPPAAETDASKTPAVKTPTVTTPAIKTPAIAPARSAGDDEVIGSFPRG